MQEPNKENFSKKLKRPSVLSPFSNASPATRQTLRVKTCRASETPLRSQSTNADPALEETLLEDTFCSNAGSMMNASVKLETALDEEQDTTLEPSDDVGNLAGPRAMFTPVRVKKNTPKKTPKQQTRTPKQASQSGPPSPIAFDVDGHMSPTMSEPVPDRERCFEESNDTFYPPIPQDFTPNLPRKTVDESLLEFLVTEAQIVAKTEFELLQIEVAQKDAELEKLKEKLCKNNFREDELQQQILELEKTKEEDLEKLRVELEHKLVSQMEENSSELEKMKKELSEKYESVLQGKNEDLKEMEMKLEKLKEADAQLSDLNQMTESLSVRHERTMEELATVKTALEQSCMLRETAEEAVENLKERLDAALAKCEALKSDEDSQKTSESDNSVVEKMKMEILQENEEIRKELQQKNEKILELETKLEQMKEKDEQLSDLNQIIETLTGRHEQSLNELESTRKTLEEMKADKIQQTSESEANLEMLRESVAEKDATIEQLQKKMEESAAELANLRGQMSVEHEKQNEILTKLMSTMELDNVSKTEQMDQLKADLSLKELALNEATAAAETTMAELEQLREALAHKQQEIIELEKKLEMIGTVTGNELVELEAKLAETEVVLTQLRETEVENKLELEQANKVITSKNEEVAQLASKLNEFEEKFVATESTSKAELELLKAENAELGSCLLATKNEVELLKTTVAKNDTLITELNNKIDEAITQDELDLLKSIVAERDAELIDLKTKLEAAGATNNVELNQLKETLTTIQLDKEAAINDLSAKLAQAQTEIAQFEELKAIYEQKHTELELLKEENENLRGECLKAAEVLTETEMFKNELVEEMTKQQTELGSLKEQHKTELDQLKTVIGEKDAQLERSLADASHEFEQLKAELHKVIDTLNETAKDYKLRVSRLEAELETAKSVEKMTQEHLRAELDVQYQKFQTIMEQNSERLLHSLVAAPKDAKTSDAEKEPLEEVAHLKETVESKDKELEELRRCLKIKDEEIERMYQISDEFDNLEQGYFKEIDELKKKIKLMEKGSAPPSPAPKGLLSALTEGVTPMSPTTLTGGLLQEEEEERLPSGKERTPCCAEGEEEQNADQSAVVASNTTTSNFKADVTMGTTMDQSNVRSPGANRSRGDGCRQQ